MGEKDEKLEVKQDNNQQNKQVEQLTEQEMEHIAGGTAKGNGKVGIYEA